MSFLGDVANIASGGIIGLAQSGGFAGDMLTGGAYSNNAAIRDANQQNVNLAKEQMAFQERMSNSAYERATADMRRAGLNPALAYQNGGASTPSGSLATVQAERPGDVGAGFANSAKSAANLSASMQNLTADTGQKESTVKLNNANADVAAVQAQKITATAKETETNTRLLEQNLQKAKHETKKAQAEAKIKEAEAPVVEAQSKYDKAAAGYDAIADRVLNAIGGITSAAGRFFRPGPKGIGQSGKVITNKKPHQSTLRKNRLN